MLFYDAVSREEDGRLRLMMATRLLAGLEKALGFLPALTGAGMQGDHVCSLTNQFTGEGIGKYCAMAMKFGGDIRIDSAVMHGCHPASGYYTVTKADGPVILEIDHKPAISFMDGLLGPGIKPEDYPFFLLFGINLGERWGEYDENKYASRLCLGLDRERGGIVMFEPDMAEGTEFQIMFRTFELDYMKEKIEKLFDSLDGREPVFAMYIDCAGRCAGYGGVDIEDALTVRQAVAGRVPVLGIYTGVEIASVGGKPRGLDWTGVFCLFSQSGKGKTKAGAAARSEAETQVPGKPALGKEKDASFEAMRKMCERNAAKILALDAQTITLRYELELKRRGFGLLSELAVSLRQANAYADVFDEVARRINAALNMQKTLVLVTDNEGIFVPTVLQGFTADEIDRLSLKPISVPGELLGSDPVLITADDDASQFEQFRSELALPFFLASPIFLQGEVSALLVTGRSVEQPPYFTRLSRSDLETVHAITGLLGSVLLRMRLRDVTHKAETDGLTGLWNRGTFQHMVENHLNGDENPTGAFMMIDVDFFKSVNDLCGHHEGDNVLKACADAMRDVCRDSDFTGRMGGDEFTVFCRGIKDSASAVRKAAQISKAWKAIVPKGSRRPITASIGIALAPKHGESFKELYLNADSALYAAKEQGRDRTVIFGRGKDD